VIRATVPAVLREEPQFRLLFAGQALSVLGDRITFVALPFAVLAAGGGLGEVSLVAGAQAFPFFVFSLLAGVVADRRDRRAIMIVSDLVRLLCQLVAGVLLLSGSAEPWQLALLALAYGSADAFFTPAMVGVMPQVVGPVHLQAANALRGLSMSTGLVAGPALAGLLIALFGAGAALLFDAATFAVSIALLARLRPRAVERIEGPPPNLLQGLREGWQEVRSRSWVWTSLGGMSAYHVVVLPSVFVLGPVLMASEYDGAASWAIVVATFGAGSIVGDVLMLRWRPKRAVRASALCLIVASTQAAIIGSGLPIAGIAILEGLSAICVTGFFTLWETSLQEHIPEASLSRVVSYDMFASVGLLPVGAALAGPVAERFGLQETLLGMSAVGILAALAVFCVPSVRRLERGVTVQPTTGPKIVSL